MSNTPQPCPDWNPLNVPQGLCRCGCGGTTRLASRNRKDRGILKGEPQHYMRFHGGRTNFTISPSGCWEWNGCKDKNGYGHTRWNYKAVHVYRAFYEQLIGPVPKGLVLDHAVCQNKPCVNPYHLEPVTNAVNIQRGQSSSLTPEQVAEIRISDTDNIPLAKKYGVNPSTISRIKKGKRWIMN